MKSASLIHVLWFQRDVTFVTFGDAVSSWLEHPDELTTGRCLLDKDSVVHGSAKWRSSYTMMPQPTVYNDHPRRQWRHAVSKKRWVAVLSIACAALITVAVLFKMAIDYVITDTSNTIVSLGFGLVDSRTFIDAGLPQSGTSGLASSVLLANTPQAILSLIYLMYNSLFTCMHLAHEYSGYSVQRKSLRVTTPRGQQRSTYWLQLPYIYGIPLIIVSGTMHWLISQSIFLACVTVYSSDTENVDESLSAVGFSPAPIMTVLVLGSAMLITAIGMGFRKLEGCTPVAASCSVALAAAAHRVDDDTDAAFVPVMWGEAASTKDADVGHCGFTSLAITALVPGRQYAGRRSRVV